MYQRTYWKDHVRVPDNTYNVKSNGDGTSTITPAGKVMQQGTSQDQTNFNNLECGVADLDRAIRVLIDGYLALRRTQELHGEEITGATHTVTLTNSKSYPFNSTVSSPVSVALTTNRKNLYYSIEAEATSVEGGLAGDIHITDKQLNGFKVSFDGSAKKVILTLRIKGGMVA